LPFLSKGRDSARVRYSPHSRRTPRVAETETKDWLMTMKTENITTFTYKPRLSWYLRVPVLKTICSWYIRRRLPKIVMGEPIRGFQGDANKYDWGSQSEVPAQLKLKTVKPKYEDKKV
jgi:hypothetical protein